MSRNSKNAKRIAAAREMSKSRQGGNPGPKATTAKHGKTNAWWQKFSSYSEFIKGKPRKGRAAEASAE